MMTYESHIHPFSIPAQSSSGSRESLSSTNMQSMPLQSRVKPVTNSEWKQEHHFQIKRKLWLPEWLRCFWTRVSAGSARWGCVCCDESVWYASALSPNPSLSYSPVWQRGIEWGRWHMYAARPTRQMTDRHMAPKNGCMDGWISVEEKMKCLSEMQKQMVAFIPRHWESRVMAQLGTRRMSLTGRVAFWHRRAG